MAGDTAASAGTDTKSSSTEGNRQIDGGEAGKEKRKRPGVLARLWRGIFGGGGEDYEKRLKHLSNEEALVHARMKRRALRSRRMARNVIVLSVFLEVVAVTYAVVTTRSSDLNWKLRAYRVLPMFALPALSVLVYLTSMNLTRLFDRKDQKTLERLRAERQAKIDELKERTNYYMTQQLIQRYDLDPAAKAAAATVLASKLGADSGLKVFLGDESTAATNQPSGKSNDIEIAQSKGLRNRRPSHTRSHSTGTLNQFIGDASSSSNEHELAMPTQKLVEHFQGPNPEEGGWLARIAALLVGEDPTQCYALICGNCHKHNGLAKKEDFPYITYYCPHCNALNGSRREVEQALDSSSGKDTPSHPADGTMLGNPSSLSEPLVSSKLGTTLEGLPEEVEETPGL
ncbi:hypothetical protein HPP92_002548 [Vanilla planifolia]|uniref:Lunapark zinc ribbon domain-containing protein n=1 Tax=Vanilla planifolia TaxID=51239 RepID=A0A835VGD8_VANPL|nr:hypothetical protein HPP92_002548 [Vanilla planifolia]